MKAITLILYLSVLLLISYAEKNPNTSPKAIQNQNPQIFEKNKIDIDLSASFKRYGVNLIDELFQKAIRNNKELEQLVMERAMLLALKNDSLKAYLSFKQNNDAYWSFVHSYISSMKDFSINNEFHKVFLYLVKKYKDKMVQHESFHETLEKKTLLLQDKYTLLKLISTQAMMVNYQQNDLPDISKIER
jgi:hypothetical protein